MAYETGTAENERDLLDKINKFLTTNEELVREGQAWTTLLDRTLEATPTRQAIRQIAWKSTGTGVEQDIYVCASTYNNISQDTYNIKIAGGTFFSEGLLQSDISDTFINKSPYVTVCADARQFEYGIVASGRCFKVYTRITNTNICSSCYAGFILPTVTPVEYPYPLCIAGASNSDIRYSETGNNHSSIVDAKKDNFWLFTPDQTWRTFSGRNHSSTGHESQYQILHPAYIYNNDSYNILKKITGLNDNYPLFPIEIISTANSVQKVNRWGALDGVYWIPGVQRSIFDTVQIDEKTTGIILNNAYRTTTSDFYVIEYV
ncbi:hypothetical protein [Pasteurella sp. PK-2025]|uniref:hypothetical protein n=1 Tax=unclassified Pasteurella TaxID=2621516 RepID=UPI003C78D85C